MSQLLQKPFDCLTCKQQIKIAKIDNVAPDAKKKWNKFEMDGKTPHICNKEKNQQQDQQTLPKSELVDVRDEIADLKAYVKTLVTQVQLLRKEFGQAFGVVQKQD